MKKGNIIFLNGVSSSGKTTLAKVLQERLDEPYYVFNIDMFLGTGIMFPEKFATNDDAGFEMFQRTCSGMHHAIRLYSDLGMNVIVDHVLLNHSMIGKDPKILEECVELLHDYPVLFVHVACPPDELRRREKRRGDRRIGQAEDQLAHLVPRDTYDITVNTHDETQDEYVRRILNAIGSPGQFMAFHTLFCLQNEKG